jgi:hypothetical protein
MHLLLGFKVSTMSAAVHRLTKGRRPRECRFPCSRSLPALRSLRTSQSSQLSTVPSLKRTGRFRNRDEHEDYFSVLHQNLCQLIYREKQHRTRGNSNMVDIIVYSSHAPPLYSAPCIRVGEKRKSVTSHLTLPKRREWTSKWSQIVQANSSSITHHCKTPDNIAKRAMFSPLKVPEAR